MRTGSLTTTIAVVAASIVMLIGLMSTPVGATDNVAFTVVTLSAGPAGHGDSRSANIVNFDADSLLDIFISNGPQVTEVDILYQNINGSILLPISTDPLVTTSGSSVGASWADFDNDGDDDVFVSTWWGQQNLFFRNDGDGSFTQIVSGPIVAENTFSESGAWADFDGDGDVDLYVCNSDGDLRNHLYRNDGGGSFTKLGGQHVTDETANSRVGVWGDYDNDGDADIFVANESNQLNRLYQNNGDGTFTRILSGDIFFDGGSSFGASWGDYDNDNDLDLFVANWGNEDNFLYTNNGDGTFTKVTSDTVVNDGGYSVGSAWGDVDNDGDLDLFVGNSFGPGTLVDFLYYNNGDGTFTRAADPPIGTYSGWTYGCAMGDIDSDGDLDIVAARCQGASETNILYQNGGTTNHWLAVRCIGDISNRSSIGARVRVKAIIDGQPVWQMREITSQSGYAGQSDIAAWFGLGDATQADSVEIVWPSGVRYVLESIAADQRLDVEECGDDADGDQYGVRCDNCPSTSNPDQADGDADGIGDLCDNCPDVSNPDQLDSNNDGQGDACSCLCENQGDADGDGFITAVDMNAMIEVIFFNAPDIVDPLCPISRFDHNCDVFIDAVDLNELIDELFFNGPASCDPCVP